MVSCISAVTIIRHMSGQWIVASFLVLLMVQQIFPIISIFGQQLERAKSRIVGGRRANAIDYPWLANLRRKRNYAVFCGGALLSRRYKS